MNTPHAPQAVVTQAFLQGGAKRLLIGGEWTEAASGRTFVTLNPSNGEQVALIAEGDVIDIDRAVAAARAAFEGPWSRFKPFDRQRLLLKLSELVEQHFDGLAELETLEMGAPITRSRNLRRSCVARLNHYAGMATAMHGETIENSMPGNAFSFTVKEPVGVVGAIIPWNAPLVEAIWKIGPALATGCTVVLKPSEEASLSCLRFGELLQEAGVPPGVVNIVTGSGAGAGAALAAHMDVDKITFTGSHFTGQRIVQASAGNLKRLSLELGGKSPNIVFADADLDQAVPACAMAVFGNTGQVCSAGTRLFVERAIHDEFVERVAAYGRGLRVGQAMDPDTQIGPLVSAAQLERVTSYLAIGRAEGAQPLCGGERLTEGDYLKGNFVPPTVFSGVQDDMRIAKEEIFGPVISAIAFDNAGEALVRGNATIYGLGAGVWTRDINKAHRLARGLRAGSVWVNCYNLFDPAVPFGGYKMSGYGRESGLQHLEDYVNVKAITIQTGE
ncbi:aldehyde dehydrogenase family protein [Hydrogenophaga sp.]|uniref:aldehyde dehydrogenase family protein n=1 Tax=Hydrogenophaga sp. TaxID=1904254 RepID=UPI00271C6949|nr:aldehyde dehydrogenase family protein [Hydrogenophaga sp.]MDO9435325.1 aldehyde dehydrogenase family protein [Hydrogenophaga sp.]